MDQDYQQQMLSDWIQGVMPSSTQMQHNDSGGIMNEEADNGVSLSLASAPASPQRLQPSGRHIVMGGLPTHGIFRDTAHSASDPSESTEESEDSYCERYSPSPSKACLERPLTVHSEPLTRNAFPTRESTRIEPTTTGESVRTNPLNTSEPARTMPVDMSEAVRTTPFIPVAPRRPIQPSSTRIILEQRYPAVFRQLIANMVTYSAFNTEEPRAGPINPAVDRWGIATRRMSISARIPTHGQPGGVSTSSNPVITPKSGVLRSSGDMTRPASSADTTVASAPPSGPPSRRNYTDQQQHQEPSENQLYQSIHAPKNHHGTTPARPTKTSNTRTLPLPPKAPSSKGSRSEKSTPRLLHLAQNIHDEVDKMMEVMKHQENRNRAINDNIKKSALAHHLVIVEQHVATLRKALNANGAVPESYRPHCGGSEVSLLDFGLAGTHTAYPVLPLMNTGMATHAYRQTASALEEDFVKIDITKSPLNGGAPPYDHAAWLKRIADAHGNNTNA